MIILIDGYNVLKGVMYPRDVTQQERNNFIVQLGKYARKKKHSVVLVFDAGPYEWLHTERLHDVKIVYSGYNDSADDYIKAFLDEEQSNDLLLVSTDRELCRFANQRDIVTIDAQDFYALLLDALSLLATQMPTHQGSLVKLSDNQDDDLDALMMGASEYVPVKSADNVQIIKDRIAKNKTASKRTKKLMNILKKL